MELARPNELQAVENVGVHRSTSRKVYYLCRHIKGTTRYLASQASRAQIRDDSALASHDPSRISLYRVRSDNNSECK